MARNFVEVLAVRTYQIYMQYLIWFICIIVLLVLNGSFVQ